MARRAGGKGRAEAVGGGKGSVRELAPTAPYRPLPSLTAHPASTSTTIPGARRPAGPAQRPASRPEHARHEGGKQGVDHLAREVVEQRDQPEQLDGARQPDGKWGGRGATHSGPGPSESARPEGRRSAGPPRGSGAG